MRAAMNDESGVTAVMLALLMVVMLGFAAISVDVGDLYWERRQLQNGADAGVLAVAGNCAVGDSEAACDIGSEGDRYATAEAYANTNAHDTVSRVESGDVAVDWGASEATVTNRSLEPGGGLGVAHWFAPILGVDETEVDAEATAIWGVADLGVLENSLPLTFSLCEWNNFKAAGFGAATEPWTLANNGPYAVIEFQQGNTSTGPADCAAQAGQDADGDGRLPGGFGELYDDGGCQTTVDENDMVDGDPGADKPCTSAELAARLNQIVFLPVFDDVIFSNPRQYHVHEFVAFYLAGYSFPGAKANQGCRNDGYTSPSSPSAKYICGWFTNAVVDAPIGGGVGGGGVDSLRAVQLVG